MTVEFCSGRRGDGCNTETVDATSECLQARGPRRVAQIAAWFTRVALCLTCTRICDETSRMENQGKVEQ